MPVACEFRGGKGNNEKIFGQQIGTADHTVAWPLTPAFTPKRPYRFFYRTKDKTVWLVAVWHGARPPDEPEKDSG
jgi:hypothetical protein